MNFLELLTMQNMAIVTFVAGLFYVFRWVPNYLVNLFDAHFMIKMTFSDHDPNGYSTNARLAEWLLTNPEEKKLRHFRVQYSYDPSIKKGFANLWPLSGRYITFRYNRFWMINISQRENVSYTGATVRERVITVKTFGTSRSILNEFLTDFAKNKKGTIKVTVFGGNDSFDMDRPMRPIDTIYLPDEQKERIIGRIEEFYKKEDWYVDAGIPWRTGFLFRGEPGTGKTSTIFALASYFDRPIYVINLNSFKSDEELIDAVQNCDHTFVVIEDFDGVGAARDRTRIAEDAPKASGVSISGLLNAFDGLASGEGRILFLTTNHETHIDPALLRPGRIDHKETFELANEEVGYKMALRLKS